MKVEARTLPGFMELLPKEQILFNQMKEKIQKSYEKFGFLPLDTPIIEMANVLLAKAGGETEKQIYRFQKGDNDLALRFDLTVPLAKYITEYYNELSFPFRRYQIGKVYRGERPQKGRFREFYQCDIDIIGDGELSIINDAEIPSIIYNTIRELGFEDFTICINNRKILNGLFQELNQEELSVDIMRIIDKLEKIGEENVKASFFVIGKCVDSHPEITKRAYDEGHYIANHGYSHNNNLLYKSSDNFLNELKKTDLAIGNAIGVPNYCSHIFRFPNGFMSPSNKAKKKEAVKLLQNIDFNYIDWNCLNNDSVKKYSSSQLLNNLIKSSQNKDVLVILMHDTKDVSNSSIVLKDSIKYLKDKGYIFKNFYDIL